MEEVDSLGFDIQLDDNKKLEKAARAIAEAEFIVFTAGAGFSADSGLACYKDVAKFPAYEARKLSYSRLCNPDWIHTDPSTFYGFWGKCYNDYQDVKPHEGYEILLKIKESLFNETKKYPYKDVEGVDTEIELKQSYVYTSNVDGFFLKSGFKRDEVVEIHGTCDWWQCTSGSNCYSDRWELPPDFRFHIDMETMLAEEKEDHPLNNRPKCPKCGKFARPNVLMFSDAFYETFKSEEPFYEWRRGLEKIMFHDTDKKLVVIECGAGTNVPTIRYKSESLIRESKNATLIRINVDFPSVNDAALKPQCISFQAKALDTLRDIYDKVQEIKNKSTTDGSK